MQISLMRNCYNNSCGGTVFTSNKKHSNEQQVAFKNGVAYDAQNGLYSGRINSENSLGDKFEIECDNGKIVQAEKRDKNGDPVWIKKYSKDKYNNTIVEIFKPNENGFYCSSPTDKLLSGKDRKVFYNGRNAIDRYWFNTPDGFKRIDTFIDKSDVTAGMNPKEYYLYNGIQINAFLRDGEFRNPDIRMDCIPYEILNNPNAPNYVKQKIQKILTDNRLIADVIDSLDKLTHSSYTDKPMIVYRNAPIRWMDKQKDGILTDDAFVSTSTEKGASMEGIYCGKDCKDSTTYTIYLPAGTPFFDLTSMSEKEMLLPRHSKFKVIDNTTLEYIPE